MWVRRWGRDAFCDRRKWHRGQGNTACSLYMHNSQNWTRSHYFPCRHPCPRHGVSGCTQSVTSYLASWSSSYSPSITSHASSQNALVQTDIRLCPILSHHLHLTPCKNQSPHNGLTSSWSPWLCLSCCSRGHATPAALAPVLLLGCETAVQSTCSLSLAPFSPNVDTFPSFTSSSDPFSTDTALQHSLNTIKTYDIPDSLSLLSVSPLVYRCQEAGCFFLLSFHMYGTVLDP